jgi:hypothetical protein
VTSLPTERAEARADAGKRAPHGAHRHRRPTVSLHLQTQQLTRPCRPTPAEVLGRPAQQRCDATAERLVGLGGSVSASPVKQTGYAFSDEALGRAHDRGAGNFEITRSLRAATTASEQSDGSKPHGGVRVAAQATKPNENSSLVARHPWYRLRERPLLRLSGVVLPKHQ